jgi:succinoglycan biosynthesis transport protein ExoP
VAGGALAVIAGRLLLTGYSATALIMVDPRNIRLPQGQDVLPGYGSDPFAIESIVQLARSDAFYGRVLDGLGDIAGYGSGDRRAQSDRLKRSIAVTRRGATYLIEVTANSGEATAAETLANRAAQAIVDEQLRLRSASTDKAVKWLDERTAELKVKLRRSEEAYAAMKAGMRLTDAGQGFTLQERKLADLNQQLALANSQTSEARARRDRLQSRNSTMPQDTVPPLLLSLQQELSRANRSLADRVTALGERHPEIIALRSQVATLKAQVATEERVLRAQAEARVVEAQSREASLAKQLALEQDQSGQQAKSYVSLAELEREARSDRAIFEQLLARRKELEDSKNLELPDVRIAAPAIAPSRRSGPSPSILALAGAIFGAIGATGISVWLTPKTSGRPPPLPLKQGSGGVSRFELPLVSVDRDQPLTRTDVKSVGFRVGMSLIASAVETHNVVYVGGTKNGVGCSTVALHLAAELAARNYEVLVIETESPTSSQKALRPRRVALAGPYGGLMSHPFARASVLPALAWLGPEWQDPQGIGPDDIEELLEASLRCFDKIIIDGRSDKSVLAVRLAAAADQRIRVFDKQAPASQTDPGAIYVVNRVAAVGGA